MTDVQIIAFYEFRRLSGLPEIKVRLMEAMRDHSILGTIIIAEEGFNATVSGRADQIPQFVERVGEVFGTSIIYKSSFFSDNPFRRRLVKIKPEIVTLRKEVDFALGNGTHISPRDWNELIRRDDVYLLDTRNDYEFQVGSFAGAVNPATGRFSDLPAFVESNLDPQKQKLVAMFCTGGIRCEKFAPYLKGLGFENVFQLEGGILRYLEEIPAAESLWNGECFVFDERISVDEKLRKGKAEDHSAAMKSK